MPKRSREDSPTPPPSTASTPSASYPSSPTSTDTYARSSRASTEPSTHSNKYIQTSEELPTSRTTMKCSLTPHHETLAFPTFEEFEVHYAKVHANRCSDCRKNFPTEHFLGLHISENHDPLEEARRAKEEKTVGFQDSMGSQSDAKSLSVPMLRRRLRQNLFHPAQTPHALD